ncbi:Olfactory receptor 5V1 [Heterocephalus glaber]|uniref:Olfactory receptor 5V1 n=1 Tax=Heterocephalus glaber TaxID=10181 RepID=G5ANY8_HETGA|nr:Olfactory receptor 5V1 [Heterocephalus glaber]
MSTFSLSFCGSGLVDQYYHDIPQIVALSCSSTYMAEILALVIGIFGTSTFLTTLISFSYIMSTILKIWSAEGKYKAFSMCASYLLVACLFYGTAIFTYLHHSSNLSSLLRDRLISMLYGVITLLLNLAIYSLRNMEVKGALERALCGLCSHQAHN